MDEGHVLHPTEQLLRSGSWDPGYYGYPPLTFYLISVAAKGVDYFQSAVTTGRSLVEGIPSHDEVDTPAGPLYDILGPTELIVTGRLVMLLLGIGTVLVTGLLGGSLFGPRTGWLAALLVACCPSFVRRGSFVMVDTPTTFFAVLALYFVARFRRSARDVENDLARPAHFLAFGAGLAGALAAASKYSAVVLVPVALVAVLVAAPTVSRAVRSAVALGAGFLTGLALGLPTLALRFHETVSALRIQTGLYEYWEATASYWQSAVQTYELGVPLLLCAAAGLWQMLRRREHRADRLDVAAFRDSPHPSLPALWLSTFPQPASALPARGRRGGPLHRRRVRKAARREVVPQGSICRSPCCRRGGPLLRGRPRSIS